MANPLNLLAKLRRFEQGSDIGEYLHTEYRQNLKAIEDAFRKLSPATQTTIGTSALNAQNSWVDLGPITITASITNPTKGNVKYDKMQYRLDGPDAIIRVNYSQLAGTGTNGSGDYFITIPSSIGEIDLNTVPANTAPGAPVAQCQSWVGCINATNTTSVLQGYAIVYDKNKIRIAGLYAAATSIIWGSANAGFAGDLYFSGEFRIPLKQA